MTTDLQSMQFRIVLPEHPAVSAWFMAHWSFSRAQQGIKAEHEVIPEWSTVPGLVIIVADESDRQVGMVLFEQINPTEAIVHTALRTFGRRTDHAFKEACHEARQRGYRRFYYAFSAQNRSAHRLMERLGLLVDSVSVRPDWATNPWIFGEFS